MRTTLTGFIILFLFSNSFGQNRKSKLEITHLSGDLYVYTTYQSWKGTAVPANGMYLVTEKGVALFDTPWDSTQYQPLLDSIKVRHQKNVVMAISTHSHEDRTGGIDFLKKKGVKTYTTVLTDQISKEKGEPRAELLIKKDTTFSLGGKTFETFYGGAGHTKDNIVIWLGKEKVLYGGCLIKSTEAKDLGNLADADIRQWPLTIQTLQRRYGSAEFVIPGHDGWADRRSLEHTLRLLELRQQGR